MTKKEFYEAVIEANVSDEITEEAKNLLEKMVSANSARAGKLAEKREAENAPIREAIIQYLTGKEATTTSEIAKAVGINTSKATPILKALNGIVIGETKVKGRTVKTYKLEVGE